MTVHTVQQLDVYGPERCDQLTLEQARAMCRRLAHGRYENFTVLSRLVPADRRDDFAAVYAFCRWADDLGDEIGDPERSLELLAWWRGELGLCFDGAPRHPVFTALAPVIARHELPIEPFDDLIRAFEQDQRVRRYATWEDVLAYCRLSANPVGRLVLMVLGEPREEERFALSDDICTALQLTNHWQDIRRDILDRDRIYLPAELIEIDDFETRLAGSAKQRYAVDQTFLGEARSLVKKLVDRTWPLYERGGNLIHRLGDGAKPIVWLLASGGAQVLHRIEMWNYETALHRPTLGPAAKIGLVAEAMFRARFKRFGKEKAS